MGGCFYSRNRPCSQTPSPVAPASYDSALMVAVLVVTLTSQASVKRLGLSSWIHLQSLEAQLEEVAEGAAAAAQSRAAAVLAILTRWPGADWAW